MLQQHPSSRCKHPAVQCSLFINALLMI